MRIIQVSVTLVAGLLAGAACVAVAAPSGPGAPLRPLSERDQRAAHGSGCQLSFDNGRSTLVYVLEHEYMIRTGAGRTVCRINDAQFSRLSEGGSMSCGGYRITIRQTGRTVAHEASDSASTPATLTVSGRGRPWTVRGRWGSAC